jgi:hypothetical protein
VTVTADSATKFTTATSVLDSHKGMAANALNGNTVVATTPYVNSAFPRFEFRLHRPYTSYLFATAPIALAEGKQVRSVTPLADVSGGAAHVFAVSVS